MGGWGYLYFLHNVVRNPKNEILFLLNLRDGAQSLTDGALNLKDGALNLTDGTQNL
jgi:hypothetical protein